MHLMDAHDRREDGVPVLTDEVRRVDGGHVACAATNTWAWMSRLNCAGPLWQVSIRGHSSAVSSIGVCSGARRAGRERRRTLVVGLAVHREPQHHLM